MHFSKFLQDDVDYNIIECDELDNNILIIKQKIDENQFNLVKLKNNQAVIIFEKGKIYDIVKEEGMYSIKSEPNSNFPEEFNDYKIKNNDDSLCVIFFNLKTIVNNKFYIKKNIKNNFFGEGIFSFKIENPVKLFNKVIEVRKYYPREELLEQIRERISKIVISVINEQEVEYINKDNYIKSKIDVFREYGIKIISCDTQNIKFKKI